MSDRSLVGELKPCPFCGEEAAYSDEWGRHGVRCIGCGVSYRPYSLDKQKAKKESRDIWNRRAS